MTSFLNGPLSRPFPLWKGQDTTFVVNRRDAQGEYLDYDPNTTAKIVFIINKEEFAVSAEIEGHTAQFVINDTDVTGVKTGSVWRLQFTIDGRDKTPVNGKVVRKDGS